MTTEQTISSLVLYSGNYIVSLRDTVEGSIQDPVALFHVLDTEISKSVKEREEQNLRLCAQLAYANLYWDQFPLDIVDTWSYSFYTYASDKTGGYQRSTIDNMVDVGRTFLLGELPEGIPEQVELYDRTGNPTGTVADTRELLLEQSASKLLVAKGAAKDGRLESNPIALGQLFNPEVSVHVLSATIQGRSQLPPPRPDKFRLARISSYIVAYENGEEQVVAELTGSDTALVRKAHEYILAACKVTEE